MVCIREPLPLNRDSPAIVRRIPTIYFIYHFSTALHIPNQQYYRTGLPPTPTPLQYTTAYTALRQTFITSIVQPNSLWYFFDWARVQSNGGVPYAIFYVVWLVSVRAAVAAAAGCHIE